MKALKNQTVAILLTAVLCLGAVTFGVQRSVSREAAQVEAMFRQGVDGSGYGIQGDLDDRVEYAGVLCKLAAKYEGLETAAQAVADACGELTAAVGASEKFAANQNLTAAVTALNLALEDAPLSEQDDAYRAEYLSSFSSCGDTISHEAVKYNAQVASYTQTVLSSFPVTLVSGIFELPEVEAFQ